MEFGKRAGGALRSPLDPSDHSPPARTLAATLRDALALGEAKPRSRRRIVGTALFGLVLGFGGVTAGTTFVQASERTGLFGLFGSLFGAPQPRLPVYAAPRRAPKRYSSLPDARRLGAARARHYTPRPVAAVPNLRSRGRGAMRPEAAAGVPVGSGGSRTVCVRTCDGYLFPLGRLASQNDLPVHQAACAAACPNSPTALFTLPAGRTELDQAVSLKGQPYLAAAWANVYRQKRVQNCSCQPPGVSAVPLAIGSDATIRIGDIVATDTGAEVVTNLVRGQVRVADYRHARNLSRGGRGEIDRRVGAIRREAAGAAFRRSLRAEAKTGRVQLADGGAARIRTTGSAPNFTPVKPASDEPQSFTPVRLISR